MSWDRMPGTGTEVPTIGEFLAGNPVPHLVPHDMSVTLGVFARTTQGHSPPTAWENKFSTTTVVPGCRCDLGERVIVAGGARARQSPPLWSHLRVPPGHLQLWVLPGISHINFMVLNLHKII